MDKQKIIQEIEKKVKKKLIDEGTGHDWWHAVRTRDMAKRIGKKEGTDLFIVELAALLHDIADWKFHNGKVGAGIKLVQEWLSECEVDPGTIEKVCNIVENVSFKGAHVGDKLTTIEGKVVQDADRLDAMGAMGIARTFAYGGSVNRVIYDPNKKPTLHKNFEDYKDSVSPSINHFYEKLLLLKDRLHTKTAKEIGQGRHECMENFLERFYQEWEGKI